MKAIEKGLVFAHIQGNLSTESKNSVEKRSVVLVVTNIFVQQNLTLTKRFLQIFYPWLILAPQNIAVRTLIHRVARVESKAGCEFSKF